MRGAIALPLRAPAVVCVVASLAIAVGACGSAASHSSSTAAAAPAAGTSGSLGAVDTRSLDAIDEARVKASSCMRSQGINIPDIGRGRGQILQVLRIIAGYPQAKVQAAMQACASEIRQAFPNALSQSPAQLAQRRQEARVFAECMRARGINFPDPTASNSNPVAYLDALSNVDLNSPSFKAAAVPCRSEALKAG